MKRTIFTNMTVVLPDRLEEGRAVIIEDGRIAEVSERFASISGEEIVDGGGGYLAPGFIDLHMHGLHEHLIDKGPADLEAICRNLPRYGVTGFLPTVCPRPKGQDAAFVRSLADLAPPGATILGFHLEGPFLAHTGALPPEALGTNDPDRVRLLREACGKRPAVFSISPDFENICDLIPIMAEGGRPVFLTHTSADVEQTKAAMQAGARHATHFYDVFSSPPESDPGVRPCGVVEAVLADPRCSVDFILDGEHVHPVAVEMALQCKGPDRVCLVTDANIGTGLPPARYRFGDEEVEFYRPGGPARLTENSRSPGTLAGSGLTMDLAVRNALAMLSVDLPRAIRMASANPAQVLGLAGRKGRIEKGFDADFVLLNKDLRVQRTWVAGESAYQANQGDTE